METHLTEIREGSPYHLLYFSLIAYHAVLLALFFPPSFFCYQIIQIHVGLSHPANKLHFPFLLFSCEDSNYKVCFLFTLKLPITPDLRPR